MNLPQMRSELRDRRIQLTKSLGQNFLHDATQLDRIAAAAQLRPADSVLEIGPGLGPLTERLVGTAGHVLAIETDARLVEFLRHQFADDLAGDPPPLTLLHADALRYLQEQPRDWSGWKVVSNLPYSVASPILVEFALGNRPPALLVTTLQLEVARRLVSRPGDDDYGVLTLLVQLAFEPQDWFKISAESFFPQPKVDSACVRLVLRPAPLLPPEQRPLFRQIVKRAFSQRRKMMFKLLKADWAPDALAAAMESIGVTLQERAEKLSLDQFVRLTALLAQNRKISP
ncbi:MAG: 16S rRNA (adenine(1518)-N(6)/adenine(1519)-N(6))-dimethyltransferase RsmA [Verrucomicrobiota bacterium]